MTLEAPGGWGAYRHYPGGGEVFYAWAALPFHSDLLVGLVDGVQWLLLALAVYGLSRQLGVIGSFSWTAAAYIFSLPALHLSIGSGYIEPALVLSLTAGLVFLIRFLKQGQGASLFLALLALGLASGMKFTLLPVAAIAVLVIVLALVVSPTGGKNTVRWFWLGSLAALIMVLPWLARNIQETDYPLSPLSVEIAGLKLGQPNETMQWFQQRLDPSDSSLSRELKALGRIFRPPTVSSIHLSLLTMIPIFLFPAMLWRLLRGQPLVGCLLALIVPVVVVPLYGSQFSVVRLLYGGTISRFLLPVVPIVVAASFLWCEKGKRKSVVYAGVMALGALVHLLSQSLFGWAWFEFLALPVWMAVLLVVVLVVKGVSKSSGVAQCSTLLMVPLLLLPALDSYRGSIRQTAIEESLVRHERSRYWTRAVRLADSLPGPGRIAVTAGPFQQADSWALYLFLGRHFQNQLFYIPITSSGEIVDFGPERRRAAAADFDAWWRRIVEKKISHVMSFQPVSLELSWLEAHPDRFRRLQGSRVGESAWGFYEVVSADH